MAEIINLRMARKARDRRDHEAEAAANRALHGRTRGERRQTEDECQRLNRAVEGARLTPPEKD